MSRPNRDRCGRSRRGSALILTLGVVIVLTSMVLLLARSTRAEAFASANHLAQLQADAAMRGALEYVKASVRSNAGLVPEDGALLVEAAPVGGGYFWIIKHDSADPTAVKFGLTDESGRININGTGTGAGAGTLSRLPRMTPAIAAAIVDWRTAGDTASSGGAKSSYYQSLPSSYRAKGDRFETVEELLLVKDVTPDLLYGTDLNHNGVLDDADAYADGTDVGESSSATSGPLGSNSLTPSSTLGSVDRGLAAYVTAYSTEPNVDSTGRRRVSIFASPGQLRTALLSGMSSDRVAAVMIRRADSSDQIRNVVDFYFVTGMRPTEFQAVADRLTTSNARDRLGLVNLNTAPREVLASLPLLTDGDVQSIISARLGSTGMTGLADLVRILPREKASAISDVVTFHSYTCSADIVAVDATGRSFKRCQAVIYGRRDNPPRVMYYRDLSALGWPLDPQILTDLRAGRPISSSTGRGQGTGLGTGLSSNSTGAR
ncbi:MAG: type II secretion system protein GspK [Planctomycetota bacterium]|nr:type II secretion system protein GspK [Planctomycetota bacterium]